MVASSCSRAMLTVALLSIACIEAIQAEVGTHSRFRRSVISRRRPLRRRLVPCPVVHVRDYENLTEIGRAKIKVLKTGFFAKLKTWWAGWQTKYFFYVPGKNKLYMKNTKSTLSGPDDWLPEPIIVDSYTLDMYKGRAKGLTFYCPSGKSRTIEFLKNFTEKNLELYVAKWRCILENPKDIGKDSGYLKILTLDDGKRVSGEVQVLEISEETAKLNEVILGRGSRFSNGSKHRCRTVSLKEADFKQDCGMNLKRISNRTVG